MDDDGAIDELTKYVRDVVDSFPPPVRTVKDAKSMIARRDSDIQFEGNVGNLDCFPMFPISGLSDPNEIICRESNYYLFSTVHDTYDIPCLIHNAILDGDSEGLLPFGKDNEDFEYHIRILQTAFERGVKVVVTGQFRNIQTGRVRKLYFFVDSVEFDRDVVTTYMTDDNFTGFMDICRDTGKVPMDIMSTELFTKFIADPYFRKATFLFCLSPMSRQEMLHIGVISAPGEGKDYWADFIVRPLVRTGKVEGKYNTTIASLVGAMDKNDLKKLGIGTLQKYHGARLVVSEMQTWSESMWGAIMSAMANGEVNRSVGQMQDVSRPACLNMFFMGNPPTHFERGDDPLIMLEGFGRKHRKQLISRFTLIFAKLKLTTGFKNKIKLIYDNMDKDSRTMDESLLDGDEQLHDYKFNPVYGNDRGRRIRERKRDLFSGSMTGDETEEKLRLGMFQHFFREYFKYVSRKHVDIRGAVHAIESSMDNMSEKEEYQNVLVVRGEVDNRKRVQFINLVRSFAKLGGRSTIDISDIKEAETIFNQSVETMNKEFPPELFNSDLTYSEMDCIRFVGNNPGCSRNEMMEHFGIEDVGLHLHDSTIHKLIDNDMIFQTDDLTYYINQKNIGNKIVKGLGIKGGLKGRMEAAGINLDKKKKSLEDSINEKYEGVELPDLDGEDD